MSESSAPETRAFDAPRLRPLAPWLLIFCVTLVAYLPVINGGLIMDDTAHITRPELRPLAGLLDIWFRFGATAHYYPILNSVFWLEHRLWGDAASGYHLINILQHALAACLVVAIVRRLALPGAWLAGLIFALHPVGVESVAWISEQKNTLSAVFGLSAVLVYLRFDRERRGAQYALALGLFLLALLTKTVTATLPPALLVIFWWQRGRLDGRRDFLPLLPWIAIGAAAGLLSAWFEAQYSGARGPDFELSLLERTLVAGRAIWFYAAKLLWPSNLMFINPRWTVDAAAVASYLYPLSVAAIGVGLFALARRRRAPLAVFLLFVGSLFPVLGFLNINWFVFSYVADHFQYLPSLALIVPLAGVLSRLPARVPAAPPLAAPAAAGLLLTALGALTWRQSSTYRDPETLYRETIARNPACWLAHNNLGTILADDPHRLADAIAHYRAALHLKPDHARAHNNLASALVKSGRVAEALPEYETSLRLQGAVAEVHFNYANALAKMPGRLPQAIAEYQEALRLKPGYLDARVELGNALARLPDRLPEAAAEFEAALRLQPDFAEVRNNLATILARMPGRLPDAIAEYERALRDKPGYAEAHNNLASALASIEGRLPDAIAQLETAVRLRPDYAEAHYNLATLLAADPARPPDEAIDHFELALQNMPDDPAVHLGLGVTLARVPGRLSEAIAQLETAVRLAPESAETHFSLARALLLARGREREALAHFETALRIRPDLEPAREMVRRLQSSRP